MQRLTILLAGLLVGPALALPSTQKVLGRPDDPTIEEGSAPFTLREQSVQLCDAGSRHWTGTVNVTADKSIFFCVYSLQFTDLGLT